MLVAWLADSDGTGWTVGLKRVQFYKNLSHHSVCKCKPFPPSTGSIVKIGLTRFDQNVLGHLESKNHFVTLDCFCMTVLREDSASIDSRCSALSGQCACSHVAICHDCCD